MMHLVRNTFQDVRYALRGWRKDPVFAVASITTLALGIGANTAIFSVVSGVLIRPLPFPRPEELVQLYQTRPEDRVQAGRPGPVTLRDFEEWRAQSKLLAALATYTTSGRNFQANGDPERVAIAAAERGLFDLLGVGALIGRTFRADDPPTVAVASHAFWNRHLGADNSVIGRGVMLDGQSFTLAGVMPGGFRFPYTAPPDLWIPWDPLPELGNRPNARLDAVVARLKPGVALEAAQQELSSMESPSQARREARIRPLKDVVSGVERNSLLVLLGAVGMVLLAASVNVANLLLARTAARAREIAVRNALGAGRFRLMCQLLTESLLLALAGGLAGLALGTWGRRILVSIAGAQIPRGGEVSLDWRVFVFLLVVCAATGVGLGLAPAIAAGRPGGATLKKRGLRPVFRDTLVIAQVALAFILLAGAGLLLRTFLNLQREGAALKAGNVLTVHVEAASAAESTAIEQRVGQIPGVRAAGLISLLPLQNSNWSGGFTIPGRPGVFPAELRYVTPGYFRAMGIPLVRGREFTPHDGPDVPRVLLVNQALARQHFPDEDPIGRRTDRGVIVGVVGDVRQTSLSVPAQPEIYYTVAQNFAQIRRLGSTLVVRSSGPPEALAGAVRAAVREVSPNQALFRLATMRQVIDESLAAPRLYAWLLGLFAVIGALLAVAGIYGVIAYMVALRTREFGIRMALGSGGARLLWLVLRRGALLVTLGLAFGLAGALALTKVLRGVLYQVGIIDPATFGATAALLAGAGLAACLAPAWRAARVDPSVTLRTE